MKLVDVPANSDPIEITESFEVSELSRVLYAKVMKTSLEKSS